MAKLIVRRKTYRELPQDTLASFANNVHTLMSTQPEYQAFADAITALGQRLEAYKDALAKAMSGGADRITIKNEHKEALLLQLDTIGDLLNASYTGNDSWIIGAGMEPIRSQVSSSAPLEAPYDLRSIIRDTPGEVSLSFKVLQPSRVRNHAIEYSLDGGESWKNGRYTSASRVHMKGLPSRQEVLFRVRSLGALERQSPWSKVLEVFVV